MSYIIRFIAIAIICFSSANNTYAGAVKDHNIAVTAYENGNYDKAFTYFQKAAEQGYGDAQYFLGNMYNFGEGVEENHKEAVKWYRKAAEQGNAGAQTVLGAMYAIGKGIIENDKEAVKWYRKAAEQGNADAQFNLGSMYAKGEGVLENNKEAYAWLLVSDYMGNTGAKESIKIIKKQLDTKTIADGQERARELLKLIENNSGN